jgi:hypothetical protein
MNPEPAAEITSRIYTSLGDTLDYTSEIDGDSLTIWFGEKGSPYVYRGRWGEEGNTLEGEWEWPGGGYEETMTRVSPFGRCAYGIGRNRNDPRVQTQRPQGEDP